MATDNLSPLEPRAYGCLSPLKLKNRKITNRGDEQCLSQNIAANVASPNIVSPHYYPNQNV